MGLDKDAGVQKFHIKPTSRLGGVGILLAMMLAFFLISNLDSYKNFTINLLNLKVNPQNKYQATIAILIASLPVFIGGLIEDLTHRVSPRVRLLLAIFSAILLIHLTGVGVERTDVPPIDWLLQYNLGFYGFTLLVIAGFTNACNIIDGFHGLASSQIMLMAIFLTFLSCLEHQYDLALFGALIFLSTFGFWVWNWPWGKIFLGDGGAYVLGFWVVSLGLVLVHNSNDISPFAPIVIGIYPLTEALFSMYRRSILRGGSVNEADALHLHSLIFRRLIKQNKWFKDMSPNLKNALVSLHFAISSILVGVISCFFYRNTYVLVCTLMMYVFSYVWLFKRLTSFRSKFW
jgi:UDP-N-acetylmuramyl pentapeptide phosphotransferase/UDP-N-acetylglucosamine-1-phosphate transferase